MISIKKHLAFTLAEVLIVLGIIGIIADMTIPTLQKNTQKQSQIVGAKKMYSDMSAAVKLMFADEGVMEMQNTSYAGSNINLAGNFLKKYFKVIKDCGTTRPNNCFGQTYRDLKKDLMVKTYNGYCVVIASGTSICMIPSQNGNPAQVMFDTNGPKSPNVAGRDLFSFKIYDNGTIDEVPPTTSDKSKARGDLFFYNCKVGDTYAVGCFAKILNDGWVMDY